MAYFNRKELERKLARVLSKDLQAELKKLLDYLGDPPDMSRVPREYWRNGWKSIAKHVEPVLVEYFVQVAIEVMEASQIGIDIAVVNSDAIEWALNNSEIWLQQTFNRTYEGVGKLIGQSYQEGWTYKELVKALERFYSPVRAEMIAVTEMTRAATMAELKAEDRLFEMTGKRRVPLWLTANDEKMCDYCAPRDRQPILDGEYPPAHPRCRCRLAFRSEYLLTPEQKAIWESRAQV